MKKIISLILVLVILSSMVIFSSISSFAATSYYLRGTFNGWDGINNDYKLTDSYNNNYYIIKSLPKGNHEYKYADSSWNVAIPDENAKISLYSDSSVLFEFNTNTKMNQATVLSGNTSFLSNNKPIEKITFTSAWYEHNDLLLTEKTNQVSYVSNKENLTSNVYWNLIPATEKNVFYLQNYNTHNYVCLNGSSLKTTSSYEDNDSYKWCVDTSTGNYRIMNNNDKTKSINIEKLNGTAECSYVPAYYLSGQYTIDFSSYQYSLLPNGVNDTTGNVVANSGNTMTSYAKGENTWNLTEDISSIPKFTAENSPLLEAVYNLSAEEVVKNEFESKYGTAFYTGENWKKVWTRDTAMSCEFSLADILPNIALNCAKEKVVGEKGNETFEEDTGSGGSYPVSTDKIITMLSVWEIYLSTGDKSVLEYFYPICKNTIKQDMNVAFDNKSGLFKGETCGTDWRDQTYPDWVSETKENGLQNIADSKAASVNIIYAGVFKIMSKAAEILNKSDDEKTSGQNKADELEKNICERLFNNDLKLFSAWEYPDFMGSPLSYKADVISNGYALLLNVGNEEQLKSIAENYPLVTYGAPTVYPQKQGTLHNADKIYHNRGVWPGWEAILMLGAKKNGYTALSEEIWNSCIRGCATSLTNKEVINFTTGEGVESNRQLWSIAGTLSGYYKVLFGMKYDEKGLTFSPYIPSWCEGPFTINNFPYQKAKLNITLSGKGDTISAIKVNNVAVDKDTFMIPINTAEKIYNIEITLTQSKSEKQKINLNDETNHVVSPSMPNMTYKDGYLSWTSNKNYTYKIYDGEKYISVSGNSYKVDNSKYGSYSLIAIDKNNVESELSKPIIVSPTSIKIEAESGTYAKSKLRTKPAGYSGTGLIDDMKSSTTPVTVNVTIPEDGTYILSCCYNNKGEPTSSNSCAIRSVYVDNTDVGSLAFPVVNFYYQKSTSLPVYLTKGFHSITVKYDTDNFYDRNMNITTNNVQYDYFTLDLASNLFPQEEEYYLVGDANVDKDVSILDATAIQKHLAHISIKSYNDLYADADENKVTEIIDASVIQKYIANIPTGTRVGQKVKK